jgi:hypothetical protein
MFKTLLLSTFAAVLPAAFAQAPPTYDYAPAIAGTQRPTSALLTDFTYRSVRPYQMAVPVLVPMAEMQAILPPGFTAIASPVGSTTSALTLSFFLDQRFQPTAPSPTTFGPTSAMLVSATVFNTTLNRAELVFPSFEASAYIAELNTAFGPGSARLAEVTASVSEAKGKLKFSFDVQDSAIGFKITVEAESSADINNRSISDPVGLAFRTFDGFVANAPFRAASQSDTLAVPVADALLKLNAPGHRLNFPAGSLTIVGYGANVTFSRNVEFILKFE